MIMQEPKEFERTYEKMFTTISFNRKKRISINLFF